MNATDAVRSGEAAGRFVFGSRNENTNRMGPGTWRELTMIGITEACCPASDGAADVTAPAEEPGDDPGDDCAEAPPPHAATRRVADRTSRSRRRIMP